MKGSKFVFDYVHLLYYKCHKINPNHDGSYIDSPDWIKNKNKYNWEGINFPSEKDDWNKTEKNTVTVALNVLYAKKETIYLA